MRFLKEDSKRYRKKMLVEKFNSYEKYIKNDKFIKVLDRFLRTKLLAMNYEERKENLLEFKSILLQIENDGEIASNQEKLIYAFDEAILSDDKLQNQRQSNDGVTLSTIHSVVLKLN